MLTPHSFKKTKNNFYEKQKYRSVFLYSILLLFQFICIFLSVKQVLAYKPWAWSSLTTPESLTLIALTLAVPTPLLLGVYLSQFETIMNDEGIFYRWYPYKKGYHMIQWENVMHISIINVKNVGWFKRHTKQYGETHYLGGGVGVQIVMKSGRRRLFSTRKAEEMNRTLIRIAGPKYTPSTVGHNLDFSD